MSAIAAVIGVFMLIFAFTFFSKVADVPGPAMLFMAVWVLALIGIIIYHIVNATRPGGVPTQIIETEERNVPSNNTAARLQELENLRSQKLVSDAEYESKRQEILKGL